MSKNYDEQKIVDYYLQYPMSIEELHEEFNNLCTVTLSRCLKRHGVNLYSKQDILTRDVNIHYFDIIDSENISDNKLCSDGGGAYSIRLANQRDFLAVTNYMYESATIYLTRKYNKYQVAVQDLYSR